MAFVPVLLFLFPGSLFAAISCVEADSFPMRRAENRSRNCINLVYPECIRIGPCTRIDHLFSYGKSVRFGI